jgi:hypothetical protein
MRVGIVVAIIFGLIAMPLAVKAESPGPEIATSDPQIEIVILGSMTRSQSPQVR